MVEAAEPDQSRLVVVADQPVVLIADRIDRDDELGITSASGNVELAQGLHLIIADTITYNERDNVVSASGNVTMLEPSGDVLFADYAELKDDLREGVISQFRARLSDGTRMAANGARRSGGNRTEMSQAVYSRCELCAPDRERAPLWQVKAKKIVHDEVSHNFAYYDAWLEMFGVPVLYTPYFEHADPTIKRRTGFLAPVYGNSSTLGTTLTTPYYITLEPWRDLIIEPTMTTAEGAILGLQYRELTTAGSIDFSGSVTRPTTQDPAYGAEFGDEVIRGHIAAAAEFEIDPLWRAGLQVERASDATYLNRYSVPKLSGRRTLVTRPFAERIDDRDYVGATGFYFQGLDAGDSQAQIPFIMPLVDVSLVGDPGQNGDFLTFDADGLILNRIDGADSRRLSLTGGWHLPYISDGGHVFELATTLRGDLYHVDNVVDPDDAAVIENGFTGRLVPEASLKWRYPLVARYGEIRTMVEPIFQAIASPYGGNPESIPNEDSQDLEFDDTNVFSSNRFTGLDRIEVGPRINYGTRIGAYDASGASATFLFGQTARVKKDDALTRQSGLDRHFSDYVGRVHVTPGDYLDLGYRFRLDGKDYSVRRSELDIAGGLEFLRLNLSYLQITEQTREDNLTSFPNREELLVGATLKFAQYWRLQAATRRDLTGGGNPLSVDGSLTYEDECFIAALLASRSFTQTRDVERDISVIARIIFKGIN
ncbi:MAG: LPS-assembly protein LptD [Alphaproteobacteria bacterium]|nr:LPS-assembly protein LptD [Alphaproteobacteria bacterium]